MKKASLKSLLAVFALFILLGSLSSCNRGYGCPNNFSMNEKAIKVVNLAIQSVTKP
ncbi:MAG: hypothetical protein IPL49_15755 [Saprospirales bacterium]|nr:hypothetical protein [Saprospirales bacterium]MBK8492291.1 hypothetical protein [Saprospirales bacterium]